MNDQSSVVARRGHSSDLGSTLIEVIVAALILATGVLAMIQLFSLAVAGNVASRNRTVAVILAAQKIEQLRALQSAIDAPVGGSLTQSASGFVDHLSASGAVVGLGVQTPPEAVYVRRWSIEPISGASPAAILHVRVLTRGRSEAADTAGFLRQADVVTVAKRVSE